VLQFSEIQEIVAEAPERQALMSTRKAKARRYQRGSISKSESGAIWYGKYYPAPGAPQKRVQFGRTDEISRRNTKMACGGRTACNAPRSFPW
jgi:hypothetical protein